MLKKLVTLFTLALVINFVFVLMAWFHHMFVTGLNPFAGLIIVLLTLLLLIPLTIFGFKRLTRFLRRTVGLSPATAFAFGAMILLTTYMVVAIFMGNSTLDSDYYYPPFAARRLYTLFLILLLFLALAAAYHLFPRITHHTLNPTLGYLHFWITLICAFILVYPQYPFTTNTEFILLAAQSLFLINLFYSTRRA